jgi:hypothetical protein
MGGGIWGDLHLDLWTEVGGKIQTQGHIQELCTDTTLHDVYHNVQIYW